MRATLYLVLVLLMPVSFIRTAYLIQPSHNGLEATKARISEIERALTLIKSSEGKSDLSDN